MQLSEKAKQLILKARIVSFQSWESQYSPQFIAIFQKADDEGRYLTEEDYQHILTLAPHLALATNQGKLLTQKANEIVSQAREQVLTKFPNITEPGGDLYPPSRAEACWRDFWHFLRCITYGIVAQQSHFTSVAGLENMALLYQELQVPLPAMVWGLENLKKYSLDLFNQDEKEQLSPYFDHLIISVAKF